MEIQTTASINIRITLAGDEAQQLGSLARRHGLTTTELVQRMVEALLRLEANEEQAAHTDWQHQAMECFCEGWDNSEDAIYDDWRAHYGVEPR